MPLIKFCETVKEMLLVIVLFFSCSSCGNNAEIKSRQVCIKFLSENWRANVEELIKTGDVLLSPSTVEGADVYVFIINIAPNVPSSTVGGNDSTKFPITIKIQRGQVIEFL